MKEAEHFKIVNDMYIKHRGGQMTSLELTDGLNGEILVVVSAEIVVADRNFVIV